MNCSADIITVKRLMPARVSRFFGRLKCTRIDAKLEGYRLISGKKSIFLIAAATPNLGPELSSTRTTVA